MDVDPWDNLNSRYRHDDRAQFLLFVEQMNEARQLLLEDHLGKQRLGLIAVDNLAEMLLYRHQQRIVRLRGTHGNAQIPRLGKRRLGKLRSDFNARVKLAREEIADPLVRSVFVPLLDQLDADVFRTAHAYRNRIYHADHHNPALLPPLGKAYLAAVGRAFTRQQPTGVAGSPSPTTERICAYGFDLSESWSPGFFPPYEAAESITAKLTSGLEVDPEETKASLSSDIVDRTHWAEAMIETLVRDGYPRERIPDVLAEAGSWQTIEADEKIVRLESEAADLRAGRWNGKNPEASFEKNFKKEAELMEARNKRVWALRAKSTPSFKIEDIPRLRGQGADLVTAKDLGALFNRYRKLDDELESIEQTLEHLAIGWDRHIQEEVDRMRGK
jgi:hypothetical protein